MARLIILAAPRGAGKTTACLRFAQLADEQGISLGGILAPARWDEAGAKTGIDILDLATGQRQHLADVEPDPAQRTVGQYRFDAQILSWALERTLDALQDADRVVLVDEIGPLELLQGEGLAPVLDRVSSAAARVILLVVRVELLDALCQRLHPAPVRTVTLTLRNRDQIPQRLLADVWPLSSAAGGEI
jgi:nucleoside-triphosphatase THEP1